MDADNNSPKQEIPVGRPFQKGKSGNPKGRPIGALNKTNRMVQELILAKAGEIIQKVIETALGGDLTAAKICIERISAPRRDAPITFTMPVIKSPDDVFPAQVSVLEQVAVGELTPSEGNTICSMIGNIGINAKVEELIQRLETMESERRKWHAT